MKLFKKGKFNLNILINVILGVFVFTTLIGTVAVSLTEVSNNISGGASILLKIITLILVIGFILALSIALKSRK